MQLGKIQIFPIKSLDGISVDEIRITSGGILENDRVYAIFDEAGRVVNGKRTNRIHQLRSVFDDQVKEISVWQTGKGEGSRAHFCLAEPSAFEKWLGDFFGFDVTLGHEPEKGFPDDTTASGPTITSDASLLEIKKWFPELTLESSRRRFRANLELTGGAPFCEDQLFGAPEELKPFRIGTVNFCGHNPCQRCVVPTRDPDSGEGLSNFQKKFMELRKQYLPGWSDARRFNHFYRFAVNTSIPAGEAGKLLRVGDPVES